MSHSKNNKNASGFLVQGSILAIASIISRIIGLIYRIPLTAILGDEGNGYYGTAFDIYTLMLLISSCSLPLAVSKMVAARMAKGQIKNAYRVFREAMVFAIFSGTAACLIVYFFADFFAGTLLKTPFSVFALQVLAPTLIIVAVLGVIRGFFQGLGTMMPSAISQIIEQIINAIVSVVAAYILFGYGGKIGDVLGRKEKYSAAYGAAGGTLGTGAGALAALFFVAFVFLIYKPVLKRKMRKEKERGAYVETYASLFRVMILTIVPVLLSTTLYNISSIIDQGIFKHITLSQGYLSDDIDVWWGVFTGKYKVLANVPIAIAASMASSSVPALAAAFANRDYEDVEYKIHSAIRFIMVIAFPCAVGLGVLASPIMQLLFRDTSLLAENIMRIGAVAVVLYSLSTLTNGILQGVNRMKAPVINSCISLVIQAGVLVVLLYAFDLNIFALTITYAFFALCMCVLNGISLYRYLGYRQEWKKSFIIPAISSAIMGVVVWLFYQLIYFVAPFNAFATIVSIVVGAVIYFVVLLVLKGLDKDELSELPGGRTIASIFHKMHII